MKNKVLLWVLIGILGVGIFAWAYYNILVSAIREDTKTRIANQQILDIEKFKNIFYTQKVDSLARVNTDLSKYKTLTMAMIHRDEVTNQLAHKVGELVYMKNDSARVVIEDVLIGGGKYNYYVKYKVLYKDQTTKEIVPELIY